MSRRAVALLMLAVFGASGCRGEQDRPASHLVAFTVTENLGIGCAGTWSVDRRGTLRWLVGNSAVYPAFRHDGRLSVGFFSRADSEEGLPLIDVVAPEDGKQLARDLLFVGFTWSPARDQLLALVAKPGRKALSLVLVEPEAERTTTITDRAGASFGWLGDDGDRIAFLGIENDKESLWVAKPDGTDARRLARGVNDRFAASPDGKRIAFRRSAAETGFTDELWVVDVGSGEQRRVPGARLPDRSGPDVWIGEQTLVVDDELPDAGTDADDAVLVDVGSGKRSLLAPDVEVLQVSRDGSTLVGIRELVVGDPDFGEEVIAVVTMKPDGTDRRLLAVADAQTGNIHGVPVIQSVARELRAADSVIPGREAGCRAKLATIRQQVLDKSLP